MIYSIPISKPAADWLTEICQKAEIPYRETKDGVAIQVANRQEGDEFLGEFLSEFAELIK